MSKEKYRTRAQAKIEGLSDRGFDRVWNDVVPPEWKRAGAPKKS
jgi:hypothetical protein